MHHDFSVINSFKKQRTYCIDLIKPPSYRDMVLLYLIIIIMRRLSYVKPSKHDVQIKTREAVGGVFS